MVRVNECNHLPVTDYLFGNKDDFDLFVMCVLRLHILIRGGGGAKCLLLNPGILPVDLTTFRRMTIYSTCNGSD